ncbi:uncharacterized protein LOC126334972 isoform X2 [Schistocerca gregaria]|nr:uncharacterized protein LOC126334972 isoform X2 [Schistocerca gregaria]
MESSVSSVFSDMVYNCKGQIVLMLSEREGLIQTYVNGHTCAYALFFLKDLYICGTNERKYSEILSYLRYTSYMVSLDAKRIVFLPSLKNKMEDITFDRLYFAPKVWVGERPHCSTSPTYWDIQSILPQLKISLSLVFKQTTLNFSNELHLPPNNLRHQLTDVSGRVIHILNSKDAVLAVQAENLSLNIIFSIHFLYINNQKCDENRDIADYVQLRMLLHCNARRLQNDTDIFMATCIWSGTKPSPVDIFSACVPKACSVAKLRKAVTYTGIVVELSPPNAALLLTTVGRKRAYVIIEVEKLSLQENDEPLSGDSCIDDYMDLTDIAFFQVRPAKNAEEFYFAQRAWLPLKMEINENIYMVSDDCKLRKAGMFLEKAYRDYRAAVEIVNVKNKTAIEIAAEWSQGIGENTQEYAIIKLNEITQNMQIDSSITDDLPTFCKNSIINDNAAEWLHGNKENTGEVDIIKTNETTQNMQTDSSIPDDLSIDCKNSYINGSVAEWLHSNEENTQEAEIIELNEIAQNMQTDSSIAADLSTGCKNSFINDSENRDNDELIFCAKVKDNQNDEGEDNLGTEQFEINTTQCITLGNSSCASNNVSENVVMPMNIENKPGNLNWASEQLKNYTGVTSIWESSSEKHQQFSDFRDLENGPVSLNNENIPQKFSWADEEPEENDVSIFNSDYLPNSTHCSPVNSEIKVISDRKTHNVLQHKDSTDRTKEQDQSKKNSGNGDESKRGEFTTYKNSGYKIHGDENKFNNFLDSSQKKITDVSANRETFRSCPTEKVHCASENLKNAMKYLTNCKKLHYVGVVCRVVALMTDNRGVLCLGDDSEAEFLTESFIGISADCVQAGMEMKCVASCSGYKKFVAWCVWCGNSTPPKAAEISHLLEATSDALNTLAANALYGSHVIALAPNTALLAIKIRKQDIPVLLTGDIANQLGDLSMGDFLEVKVRKVPFGNPQSKCFYWEASEAKRGLSFAEELLQLKEFSYKGFLRKSIYKASKTTNKARKHSQSHSASSHLPQDVDEKTVNAYDSKNTPKIKDKNYDPTGIVPSKSLNAIEKATDAEKITENKEHSELKNECSAKEESTSEVTGFVESVCCWYAMISFELSGKTEKALCYKNALITNSSLPLAQVLTVGKCVKLNIQLLNAPFQGACYRAANVELIEEESVMSKTDLKINTTATKRVTFAEEENMSVRKSETQILGRTSGTRNTLENKGQIAKVKPMIHQQSSSVSLSQSFTYHNRAYAQPREYTLMTNRGGRQYLTTTIKSHAAKIKSYISENEAVMETNMFGVLLDVRFTRNLFELPSYSRSLSLQDFLSIGQDVYFDACVTRPLESNSPSLFTVVVKGVWQGRRQRRFNSRRLIPLPINSPRQLREGPVYRTTVVEMRPPFAFVVEEMFGHEKIFVFNRAFRPDGEHGDNMLANQNITQYVQPGDEVLVTVYRNSPEFHYQFEWSARDAWPARTRFTAHHQKGKVAFIEETWGLLTTSFEAVMLQNENIYRQGQPLVINNLKEFIKKGDIICFKMSPVNPGNRYPGKTTAVFLECQC